MKTERMICDSAEIESIGYPENPEVTYISDKSPIIEYVFYPICGNAINVDWGDRVAINDVPGKYIVGKIYDVTYNKEIKIEQKKTIINNFENAILIEEKE